MRKLWGGQILIINIAFSLFLALTIISSLKHTQLSKVQSANKVFYPFFSCLFCPCRSIFTQSEQVTRVLIYFLINNDPIHGQPFQFKSKHNMKWCHFISTVMFRYHNILCSTTLVTDHANPAVKSIVILRIPKYKLLSHTNMPINVTEEYPETFFRSRNPKMCHYKTNHEQLWYSFQMPCGICK